MIKLDVSVLYIEDDEEIAQEIRFFLNSRVKILFFAKDGEDALEIYKEEKPDMIITDIQMPRMNGLEMIQVIRENNIEIPILIISAYNDTNYLMKSLNLGVDAYILKPTDLNILYQRLEKLAQPIFLKKELLQRNKDLQEINKSLKEKIIQERLLHEKHKKLEIEKNFMQYHAYYDALTGLANRTYFYELFKEAVKISKRQKSSFRLLFIDMDDFKEINDTYGHDIGDGVLKEFSLRLKASVRESDNVIRLGGDEFVILLLDVRVEENLENLVQKILFEVKKEFFIDSLSLSFTCSIGVSSFPQDATDLDTLLKCADSAMYEAKQEGKNSYKIYKKEDYA